MSDHVRVFVVDDSVTVRSIFCSLVDQENDIVVAGEAGSAEEALALLPELKPDVIALDETLPGMDGLRFIDAVRAEGLDSRIVLISADAWPGAPLCSAACEHGAVACFDKSRMISESEALMHLIKCAAADDAQSLSQTAH